ncbi:MAG: sulfate ABC transporter permease subunit [Anaerolineae bacterium]|nr:sulfate ABC transporter permease subunit [Anaerolineae bacterium]
MVEKPVRGGVAVLLVLLVLAYAGVLLIAPITALVQQTFSDGLQPVLESITAPDALEALRLTIIIALAAAAINTLAGILVAWVLVRHDFPGRGFLNGLVELPFVMSPVIVGYVVIVLFGREGWFRDLPLAFTPGAMLLVTVFVSLPFVIREVMPVLRTMTPEQEEAAFTLGASRLLTFRRIVFPAIGPAVIYGVVLTLARALGEFGAAAVAGGGVQGYTENATIYIFRSIHDRNDTGAYSMAILLGIIAIVVLVAMNALKQYQHKRSQ